MDLADDSYQAIYQELVYQRNEAIRWLDDLALTKRKRRILQNDENEFRRHQTAKTYRPIFREDILNLLSRLYSHDATEAIFDFETADLGDWSDTEANMLEREIQRLQLIIGKLESRYDLQYKIIFEYDNTQSTLFLNRNKVLACGQNTLKHRLLTTLFSDPGKLWGIDDIDSYFSNHFGYTPGDLKDRSVEKASNDIKAQVATKTGVKDFLLVSNSSTRINTAYLP